MPGSIGVSIDPLHGRVKSNLRAALELRIRIDIERTGFTVVDRLVGLGIRLATVANRGVDSGHGLSGGAHHARV